MKLVLVLAASESRVRATFGSRRLLVRAALSRDARSYPFSHSLPWPLAARTVLTWEEVASVTARTRLVMEIVADEGDGSFCVLGGARPLPLAGDLGRVTFRDVYDDEGGGGAIASVALKISGGPSSHLEDEEERGAALAGVLRRCAEFYRRSPLRRMRVPKFAFPGGAVPGALVARLRVAEPMDRDFARSALDAVLESAGWTPAAFARALRWQWASATWGRAGVEVALVLGQFLTFTANLMLYRSDVAALDPARMIEKIKPHVREDGEGDCEDVELEIHAILGDLRRLKRGADLGRDPVLVDFRDFARLYVGFVVSGEATAPSAGGGGGSTQLHIYGLALPWTQARDLGLKTLAPPKRLPPWAADVPALVLEGTNWSCPLLLNVRAGHYGATPADVAGLEAQLRLRAEIEARLPAAAGWASYIYPSLDSSTTSVATFNEFYLRATELWLGDGPEPCFAPFVADAHGAPLYAFLLGDPRLRLRPVYRLTRAESDAFDAALDLAMPIPPWRGPFRDLELPGDLALDGPRPRRTGLLSTDCVVYRFRGLGEAAAAVRALRGAGFAVGCRAQELPPRGHVRGARVYARKP